MLEIEPLRIKESVWQDIREYGEIWKSAVIIYVGESVNRSQMDINHRTCDVRT
jgi:hypothetical protein